MLIVTALALAGWPDPPTGGNWITVRDDQIRIQCTVADGLNWCRAEAVVAAPATQVRDLVMNFQRHVRHFTHIHQFEWLDERTAYLYIDYPNPLADRDYIARYTTRAEGGTTVISWVAAEHAARPVRSDVVRLTRSAGRWTITPHAAGASIRYEWEADIGIDVPGWIVRRASETHGAEIMDGIASALATTLVAGGG